MKTVDEIKKIWKKSMIECVTQQFTMVEQVAIDEAARSEINMNNIQACMSQVRDNMEKILESHGITDEDKEVIREHADEWVNESMPWIMDLILDSSKLNIKETLAKKGN